LGEATFFPALNILYPLWRSKGRRLDQSE